MIYILNGPNLNMLGTREPHIYGSITLAEVEQQCQKKATSLGYQIIFRQTNHEGVLIDWVQEAHGKAKGLVINPGGLTHTSICLFDALSILTVPIIEVHVSNIYKRESFRHTSVIAPAVTATIAGFGSSGYTLALNGLTSLL